MLGIVKESLSGTVSSVYYKDRAPKSAIDLPDNCTKCGVELTCEDFMYLCDFCFRKKHAKRFRQHQMAS